MSRFLALASLLALAAGACGCGDGGGSPSTTTTATQATASKATAPATTTSPAASKAADRVATVKVELGSPSEVPRTKGGDNSIQDFGAEASRAERLKAAMVLASYLHAYAAGDTRIACTLVSSGLSQLIGRTGQAAASQAPKSCPEVLGAMSGGLDARTRQSIASARVLSLRVAGTHGFAIYKGAEGQAYAMPMVKEGGAWKVGGIAGTPLG